MLAVLRRRGRGRRHWACTEGARLSQADDVLLGVPHREKILPI